MQGLIKPRLFLFLGDPDRPPRADDLEDDDGHNEGVDRHDDHAEELHELAHSVDGEAQQLLHDAVVDFTLGNEKLEEALRILKGE